MTSCTRAAERLGADVEAVQPQRRVAQVEQVAVAAAAHGLLFVANEHRDVDVKCRARLAAAASAASRPHDDGST